MTMHERSPARGVPPIIHIVNLAALLLGSLLLLLTAVAQTYQLALLAPMPVLLVVYWRSRKDPRVAAGYFGIALALLG
jgi:membrane protein implicated in regulation of membrane protease activity